MRRTRGPLTVVVATALLLGACAGTESGPGSTLFEGTVPSPQGRLASTALVEVDSCEAFLDYVIDHAVELVGPYGLDWNFWGSPTGFDVVEQALEGADDAAPSRAGGSFSETNVQVEGVDEPDIVKTDGNRIVVVDETRLIVVDVTGSEPVETGRLDLGGLAVQSIFLSGDTVLAFGSGWHPGPAPLGRTESDIAMPTGSQTVSIVEIDIVEEPEVVRTMEVDGALISGRMVEDSIRLVLTSGPVGFEWAYPEGSGLRAEREATEKNREIVRDSSVENWVPYYVVTDAAGEVESEGVLFDCDRARHPDEFSGLDMLSIITIDSNDGLTVTDATGVLASGSTVYGSQESLYVATQNWDAWRWLETGEESDRPDGPSTEIHKFDTSDPELTEYSATGAVAGYLLNQFSLDEHEEMLRVASTTDPNGWGSGADSESRVTVLRQVNDELIPIGVVSGLGETERIYSVRFMGEVGYVVTFRQTDPLYTIDLSNPRSPRMLGELKIPGYSAYLHPAGEGLLLGVGQDATDDGRVVGTQVSLFDVSDPGDPQRLDTYTLSEGTNSEVEYDHHAFLYWDDLAVIPVQRYWWDDEKDSVLMGAIGLRVDGDHLVDVDDVVHPGGDDSNWDWRAQIRRSVVVGDSVYTISGKGMMKSDLTDLDEEAWLAFDS